MTLSDSSGLSPRVLVVDDDQRMREMIEEILLNEGYDFLSSGDSREAALIIRDEPLDALVTDLRMPHLEGMELLSLARETNPDLPVVVITGYGTVESATSAMKQGAYDFLQKPFDPDVLVLTLARAVNHYRLVKEHRRDREALRLLRDDQFVGSSPAMDQVRALIQRVASVDITVLIQGETGTGKEIVARMIHKNSPRKNRLFLPVNCGAMAETLLESELFGHEKGAFTGAERAKPGLLKSAHGGTLFLDEIHLMPPQLQVKLLRFLQDGTYLPVGGTREQHADIRIVAATNQDLALEVKEERFRNDLFFRLNVMRIDLPPLRDRGGDIEELAYHFLKKYSARFERDFKGIDRQALRLLRNHSWPGNVRELENVLQRAVIMEMDDTIKEAALPPELTATSTAMDDTPSLMTLAQMEQILIKKALRKAEGNRAEAARILGIDPSTLWRKQKRTQKNAL